MRQEQQLKKEQYMESVQNKPYTRERAWENGDDYIDLSSCIYIHDRKTATGHVTLNEPAWIIESTIKSWDQKIIPKNNEADFDELISKIELYAKENGFKEVDLS
jgi:hypothetical protein